MKAVRAFFTVVGVCAAVMCFIHRRVIQAIMNGDPIPEAPASHTWVKNRKK